MKILDYMTQTPLCLSRVLVGGEGMGNGPDEPAGRFGCGIETVLGNLCGYVAKTRAGLSRHEITSAAPGHIFRSILVLATVTNQCPLCRSVFDSVQVAHQHQSRAIACHKCETERGGTDWSQSRAQEWI
jgi:hypothetical protein